MRKAVVPLGSAAACIIIKTGWSDIRV